MGMAPLNQPQAPMQFPQQPPPMQHPQYLQWVLGLMRMLGTMERKPQANPPATLGVRG